MRPVAVTAGLVLLASIPAIAWPSIAPAVRWVDCEEGSDDEEGLDPETAMRSLRAAIHSADGDAPLELHLLPGTCPSEGGIALPTHASVIGSGPTETFVQDTFLLSPDCVNEREEEGCRYSFEAVELGGVRTAARSTARLLLDGVSVTDEVLAIGSPAGDSTSVEIRNSEIERVTVIDRVLVRLDATRVRNLAVLGFEEGAHADAHDCEIGAVRVAAHGTAVIRGSTLRGESGTAVFQRSDHGGGGWVFVSDSVFEGYEHHVHIECPVSESNRCGFNTLVRNTFVGASSDAVRLIAHRTTSAVVRDNAFFEIGGAAVRTFGDHLALDLANDNFDQVGEAVCREDDCALPAGNLAVPSGFLRRGDYHLRPTSGLVDAADVQVPTYPIFPAVDRDGVPRPYDGDHDGVAESDIGAYEYCPGRCRGRRGR